LTGVSVGKDGKVRTLDGRVIKADDLTIDKAGRVFIKPQKPRTGANGAVVEAHGNGERLSGVSAHYDPDFAASIEQKVSASLDRYMPEEIEYIVGGDSSDGTAKTFKVPVDDDRSTKKQGLGSIRAQ
jgi:hypothetical protein